MKRYIYVLLLLAFFSSCVNRKSYKNEIKEKQRLEQLKQQEDSIDREKKFEVLGDTVFSTVLFGMNEEQFNKAFEEFYKKTNGLRIASFDFALGRVSNIEKEISESLSYISLDYEFEQNTIFFQGKLSSVQWNTLIYSQKAEYAVERLDSLVTIFEKRYGKPNKKKIMAYQNNTSLSLDVIWETEHRLIKFNKGLVSDCYKIPYDPNNIVNYLCQEEITISFINKDLCNEINNYLNEIMKQKAEEEKEKHVKDSISDANALW